MHALSKSLLIDPPCCPRKYLLRRFRVDSSSTSRLDPPNQRLNNAPLGPLHLIISFPSRKNAGNKLSKIAATAAVDKTSSHQ